MSNLLSDKEQKLLLEIARESITGFITDGQTPPRVVATKKLLAPQGCFVTIRNNGDLRGCIGIFVAERPLFQMIQDMAVSAATRDPRFYPMKKADLDSFKVEISVLSPLKKIERTEEIKVGMHGLYLEKRAMRGVLLPQVAVENRWDRETFLSQTCLKAGLRHDEWREGTDIYTFKAQVFGEP